MYLSGVWLRVGLRMDTKKICVYKRLGYVLKNMLTVLVSEVEVVGETYMTTLIARTIFYFDDD